MSPRTTRSQSHQNTERGDNSTTRPSSSSTGKVFVFDSVVVPFSQDTLDGGPGLNSISGSTGNDSILGGDNAVSDGEHNVILVPC